MIKNLKPGIKRSVLVIAVLPACAVALLLTLIFSTSQIRSSEQAMSDRGFALIRQLAPASEYGVYSGNPDILQSLIDAVLLEQDVAAAEIRQLDGHALVTGGQSTTLFDEQNLLIQAPMLVPSSDGKFWVFYAPIFQTEFSDNLFDETPLASTSSSIVSSSQILGTVVIALSLERILAHQTKIWVSTSLIAISVLMISAILAVRLGRRITDPVLALKAALADIEKGDLSPQLNSGASGELLALESGVKSMARSLKLSRENLEDRVDQATSELRATLAVLEQRNNELDNARGQAEAANEAKSQFLAKISHEFRTPLNGIYGFLQLLKKSSLDEKQRDFVRKIGTSTEALLGLINEILDFSKIEISETQIKNNPFNLKNLLTDCVDVSLPEAQSKGLLVRVDFDDCLPEEVIGDAGHIAQILRNLINNAVKFTDMGEVVVRASHISSRLPGQTVHISVTDTGIGIPYEDQKALFQPFSQLEPAMTRRHGGTGLGLAISKSLVELMGGTISINSSGSAEGSCFSITLPLELTNDSDANINVEKPDTKTGLMRDTKFESERNLRVLLADDNLINRQFLSTWLEQIGATVDEARDGQEAVECCRRVVYDIIFMDLHMPNMDGLEATMHIRKEARGQFETPIIAVTADVTEEAKSKLAKSDINDYLVKPVCEQDLLATLKKWSDHSTESRCQKAPGDRQINADEAQEESIDRALGIKLASGDVGLWSQSLINLSAQLKIQKEQIMQAFESSDTARVNQLAHNIIGSASYCGATELLKATKKFKAQLASQDALSMEREFVHFISKISRTIDSIDNSNMTSLSQH